MFQDSQRYIVKTCLRRREEERQGVGGGGGEGGGVRRGGGGRRVKKRRRKLFQNQQPVLHENLSQNIYISCFVVTKQMDMIKSQIFKYFRGVILFKITFNCKINWAAMSYGCAYFYPVIKFREHTHTHSHVLDM